MPVKASDCQPRGDLDHQAAGIAGRQDNRDDVRGGDPVG
jgi:hypothetical protein